jgi:N-acetylglucosamine-6-sulfatase
MTNAHAVPAALFLILPSILGSLSCGGAEPRRPNILLLYADDLRHEAIGGPGSSPVETPNLDRLSSTGLTLGRAYASTSRCCPSRASLLTGLGAPRHGIWNNHPEVPFPGNLLTLADHLQGAGYATAWIGKWHLPNPGAAPVRGFDHWASYEGAGKHFDQLFLVDGREVRTSGFQTDSLVRFALDFLDRKRAGKPFFLCVAFKAPHVPLTPSPRRAGTLRASPAAPPPSASDPPETMTSFHARLRTRDARTMGDVEQYQNNIRAYWELVGDVDDAVGAILAGLEERSLTGNTIVLFTSDNGQLLGEHGVYQKGVSYEPAIRLPMVLSFPPTIPGGLRSEELVREVDLLPTLLDLCRLPIPADLDGKSLRPLWSEERGVRDVFLYLAPHFAEGLVTERALLDSRWKYVRITAGDVKEERLWDLETDPEERVDRSGDPTCEGILERLSLRMDRELEALGL